MTKYIHPVLPYVLILLIATGLHGQAFVANSRAYGNVNLMSLAAKQDVLTSTVRYPSPGSRFPYMLNDPLATPTYNHGAA